MIRRRNIIQGQQSYMHHTRCITIDNDLRESIYQDFKGSDFKNYEIILNVREVIITGLTQERIKYENYRKQHT